MEQDQQQSSDVETPFAGVTPPPGAAVAPPSAVAPLRPSRGELLWREWFRPLLIIGVLMFSFRSAVADWNDVPTGSMKPTILEGDRIFINKVAYDFKIPFTMVRIAEWGDPLWGDIVVLRSPEDGKRLVKRVVGVPGDTIEMRRGRLYVNDLPATYEELDDQIVHQIASEDRPDFLFAAEGYEGRKHPVMINRAGSMARNFGPRVLGPTEFFVMGDNRDNSRDSRWFGPVERELILGRATAVALSVDPSHYYLPRWGRFFSRLP